jgi:hypothetical protein
MTDGMLFRETMVDPLLSRYSVIMVVFPSAREDSIQCSSRLMKHTSAVSTLISFLVC